MGRIDRDVHFRINAWLDFQKYDAVNDAFSCRRRRAIGDQLPIGRSADFRTSLCPAESAVTESIREGDPKRSHVRALPTATPAWPPNRSRFAEFCEEHAGSQPSPDQQSDPWPRPRALLYLRPNLRVGVRAMANKRANSD